tara:strand:+ start:113 stop:529 length:417 start_codon:yes stop_codon:yes gene_type:complete
MSNEVIGYAELTMNAQGYAMYEVSKDHEAKCISIRKVRAWRKDLPFFGRSLPRYSDEIHAERWAKINAYKPKPKAEYRWKVANRGRGYVPSGQTFASRPLLSAYKPRPMSERNEGKQMSQAEVKRLLAEALGMDGDEQ